MSSPEHKEKIWNFIKDIGVGMLVTQDDEDLRARPMHIVQDDYDGTLWFFTKLDSGKTEEILEDKKVCLTFCNHSDSVHVSLSGKARLLPRDQGLIDKFWNAYVAAWFPEGKEDPNIALLEIKIYQGEHWSVEDNQLVELYEIMKANITNSEPDIGNNEKF